MDFEINLEDAQSAQLRQEELPQMLRDIVEGGAEELELVIDAHTALRIAQAIEMMTQWETLQNGE